jgi:hypothetical protein
MTQTKPPPENPGRFNSFLAEFEQHSGKDTAVKPAHDTR